MALVEFIISGETGGCKGSHQPVRMTMLRVLQRAWLISSLLICVSAATVYGQGNVPAPESVLGFKPGADFKLFSYDQAIEYLRIVDEASDRLVLMEVGRTTNNHPMHIAVISSEENLRNLERYREISIRLAHPEGLTDEEARALAREGRAIVHIDGGMHSSEVADHQHTIKLAYDLVTGHGDPEIRAILDNVIFILWPTLNPEGQNMVAEWYLSNVGTPHEVASMPWLYQEYVGHDNNRDGYMLNMIESRVITRVLREWEPQILYNHHQTAPFPTRIWIPPFAEPVSPYVHPLMWRTVNLMGMAMSQALEERGQEGATHMGTGFDDWYPGFMDHANSFHNIASFLTETGLYRYATPHFYTVNDFPEDKRDLRPESLYPSPWKGGWWRLSDACSYMHAASISVLDFAAKYKFDVLYNRYQAGRDVIADHETNPPFAYFIPQEQRDPVAPVEMLRRLAYNGVEVHQLTRAVEFQGIRYSTGTWVIPMNQPFAYFVRQLFDVQEYPDLRQYPEGPMDQPYDVSGWTLPYQMDVRVVEATEPLTDDVVSVMKRVEGPATAWNTPGAAGAAFDTPPDLGFDSHTVASGIVPLNGTVTGSGTLSLDPAQNNTFRAINEAWKEGGRVQFRPGKPGGGSHPGGGGSYLISGISTADQSRLVESLALQAERVRDEGINLSKPRIALYEPWGGSIDAGWTQWLLEVYQFEFTRIRPAEVRAGRLLERFDVIIVADIGSSTILNGLAKGSVPGRYVGGIGKAGVRALQDFVHGGGTLVCMNGSCNFAIGELNLPVEDVTRGVDREELFISSCIAAATADPGHPVMAGMPVEAKIFIGRSPVFTTMEDFRGSTLMKYPERGELLLSGYLQGEDYMKGYAAALDVHHGGGHVILLGFRPQWRCQSFGTFRILLNAALYHGPVAAAGLGTEGFWSPPERQDKDK